jgi:hypothetical protein
MPEAFQEFRTIPIDFEVFKALTAKLENPEDSYNQVLRRELGLPASPKVEPTQRSSVGGSWQIDGAVFPHRTEFRARYKGRYYVAVVDNGALVYGDERYDSPSPAAVAITGNSVNGWKFWQCRVPGTDRWVGIDSLRRK